MKIVGIGDLLIPGKDIEAGLTALKEDGHELKIINWHTENYEELQNINLQIETEGSEAYEVPSYILDGVKEADIIITQFCPINKKVLDYCRNLKAIGVLRSGIENVNLAVADEKGIIVLNTPGRNANAVADYTVGMLLSECRNIAKSHMNMKNGKWVRDYTNKDSIPDLCDKTAGLVGLGQIGHKVAARLRAFEMNVVAYDPYVKEAPEGIKMLSLEELMTVSDFVSLHARLTPETEHLINGELIKLMKPTAYIINTARSGLIDEDALYEALKNKSIVGAAIDVFDKEPPGIDYPLVTLENITITPHNAGGTRDAFTGSPKLLSVQMKKYLAGEDSRSVVNKDTYHRLIG